MAELTLKMADIGEGVAEVELVSWLVKIGDLVREDQTVAEVMTDKATVEIPSPKDGVVIWLAGEAGDKIAVGSPLLKLELAGAADVQPQPEQNSKPARGTRAKPAQTPAPGAARPAPRAPHPSTLPLAAPTLRARARELGIDLAHVTGTGPEGRITEADLDAFVRIGNDASASGAFETIKVIGLRRKIAERLSDAWSRIPHITYVEEVDVTALETLRAILNENTGDRPKLTLLPFIARAICTAIAVHPHVNAHFDDKAGVLKQFKAAHIGIATQTPDGLVAPVLRDAQSRNLWDKAAEIARLAEAARNGKATRQELSGSTITITSLGKLGGIVTTPIINAPEVAIIGINKVRTAPVWDGAAFAPRRVMNISASFDHRVIDGYDAALFIQKIKSELENPDTGLALSQTAH
jgi:2-oxoisovalerate dehydrogenase E2 component (dihydrolipoyl transacylase)